MPLPSGWGSRSKTIHERQLFTIMAPWWGLEEGSPNLLGGWYLMIGQLQDTIQAIVAL